MRYGLCAGVLLLTALSAAAQAAPEVVVEGKNEVLYLDDLGKPSRWGPSECTVTASKTRKADGRPTLRIDMPVDHHGGEKRYPIGWPRLYAKLRKPTETQWGAFERFEFLLYATMSRAKPPTQVATFHILCPDRRHATYHRFRKIKLGEWIRVSVPVAKIKDLRNLQRLGFNISESNYKHGDKLRFFLGGFRLVRPKDFELRGMKVRNAVLYQGQPTLKVDLVLAGPPVSIHRALPLTVLRGKERLRVESLPVKVGAQTLEVDIRELKLKPGTYTLTAYDDNPKLRKTARFRVLETPWQER